jgi:hypothetical protein
MYSILFVTQMLLTRLAKELRASFINNKHPSKTACAIFLLDMSLKNARKKACKGCPESGVTAATMVSPLTFYQPTYSLFPASIRAIYQCRHERRFDELEKSGEAHEAFYCTYNIGKDRKHMKVLAAHHNLPQAINITYEKHQHVCLLDTTLPTWSARSFTEVLEYRASALKYDIDTLFYRIEQIGPKPSTSPLIGVSNANLWSLDE